MKLKQYQVDAFAERVFEGNPAAVCPLTRWLNDETLQAIAGENNLSETAYFVPVNNGFHLRWFTPIVEVDLCGHATLAAAHVVFEILGYRKRIVDFETRSGKIAVQKSGNLLAMDFPSIPPRPCSPPTMLLDGLGKRPVETLAADDYIAIFESEDDVCALTPDSAILGKLDLRGVVATAPGRNADFVSRFFAPKYGIPEDPVTGSAHCELAPYWSSRLGKTTLNARQVSRRGGNVLCELKDTRVILSGTAVTFMVAEIKIGDQVMLDGDGK
ncbi:MAG TPA: PhzF family phenazine biosynthesis protein [Kiritimatiellia bacterium]|nr:PhzF family phenazine biosynthesis protein [Kiritimatiellia bacterium]